LAEGQYRELPLETGGDGIPQGHSAVPGLDICALPGLDLRLYDPASGQWLLTPRESEEARLTAKAALHESETARDAPESENERLRGQLRLLQSGQ
jgi:hypothetical protein